MKIKCDYCDSYFEDYESCCPNCGATNRNIHRTVSGTPKTIEELKAYCDSKGYTAERTRFFIGEDHIGPRAFGIYRNSAGEYVVYKNKNDGSRAIRYQGMDEAYAVNELYQRLQEEVLNQKNHYVNQKAQHVNAMRQNGHVRPRRRRAHEIFDIAVVVGVLLIGAVLSMYMYFWEQQEERTRNTHNAAYYSPKGYYYYDDAYYYHSDGDSWYYWRDEVDDWQYNSSLNDSFPDNMEDYLETEDYEYNSAYTDFEDSFWYNEPREDTYSTRDSQSSSYDYDDYDDYDDDWDSDWSSNDWDSGYTDWDSDW